MKRLLLAALLVTNFTALSFAGFDEEIGAYKTDNYTQALEELRPLAEKGDAAAQNSLGVMYEQGKGVPRNQKKAVFWYRKAADQGLDTAQYNLYRWHIGGEGKDYKKAAAWCRKAAEQGHAGCLTSLGVIYNDGLGVPPDRVLAHMLYTLGDALGDDWARGNLDLLVKHMTPRQIEEAQELTRKWKVGTPLPTRSETGQVTEAESEDEFTLPAPRPKKLKACNPPTGKTLRYTDNCYNGDCVRTFENGCQKRFQAPYCYDALGGNWTWKPDGC